MAAQQTKVLISRQAELSYGPLTGDSLEAPPAEAVVPEPIGSLELFLINVV